MHWFFLTLDANNILCLLHLNTFLYQKSRKNRAFEQKILLCYNPNIIITESEKLKKKKKILCATLSLLQEYFLSNTEGNALKKSLGIALTHLQRSALRAPLEPLQSSLPQSHWGPRALKKKTQKSAQTALTAHQCLWKKKNCNEHFNCLACS